MATVGDMRAIMPQIEDYCAANPEEKELVEMMMRAASQNLIADIGAPTDRSFPDDTELSPGAEEEFDKLLRHIGL